MQAKKNFVFLIFSLLFACQPAVADEETLPVTKLDFKSSFNKSIMEKSDDFSYGDLKTYSYHSNVSNIEKHYSVITPDDYSVDKHYPLVMVIPSLGQDNISFADQIHLKEIYFNLKKDNKVQDAIFLIPNHYMGYKETFEINKVPFDDTSSRDIHENVLPDFKKHYENITDIYLYGFSLGGRIAANYVLEYGSNLQASILVEPFYCNENTPIATTTLNNLSIIQGKYDGVVFTSPRKLSRRLNKLGVKHDYYEVNYSHDPVCASEMFYRFISTYLGA